MRALKYRWGALRGEVAQELTTRPIQLLVDGQPIETSHPQWRGPTKTQLKLRMPPALYDGADHSLAIQTDDGSHSSEVIEITADELWRDRFDSNVMARAGLAIAGWVQDAAQPDADVPLVCSFNDQPVDDLETALPRPTVYSRFGGKLECGFSMRVPERLLTFEEVPVRVTTEEGGVALKGGPHRFELNMAIDALATSARSRLFNARQVCWNNSEK